jgi:hypothetical protein
MTHRLSHILRWFERPRKSRLRAVGIQDADLEDLLHKAEGRLIEAGRA